MVKWLAAGWRKMKAGINNIYGSALRNTLGARFNFLEGRTRQAHGWIGGVFTIKRISGVGGSFRRSCYDGLHCDVSDPGIHPLLAIHTCLITVSALCCSFPLGLKFEARLVLWLAWIVQWLEGYQGLSTCARLLAHGQGAPVSGSLPSSYYSAVICTWRTLHSAFTASLVHHPRV